MTNEVDFSRKSLILITGASRGIGRQLALSIAKRLNPHSTLILIARSEEGLDQTKTSLLEIDKTLTVHTHSVDLAKTDADSYRKILDNAFSASTEEGGGEGDSGFDLVGIFHNAGSTGALVATNDLDSFTQWRSYFDLNLFSASVLNSVWLNKINSLPTAPTHHLIVNITSLVGRSPFKNLAQYGCAKAARDMFFKIVALENAKGTTNADGGGVIVLNYSPGPVDTEMFEGIVVNAQSSEVRDAFRMAKESDSFLTAEQTVEKMLGVLEKGDYVSGDILDYFDL